MNNSEIEKEKKEQVKSLDEQLIDAATVHKLSEINRLIKAGANVNYVRYTDANCWYSGNTHTALYNAVHAKFNENQQSNYVDVLQALLKAGANPNFKAIRGGWNHSTSYPLFTGVSSTLSKFKNEAQKIRFIEIFVKHGININQNQSHSRSKNWRGYSTHTCFIFQMMDSAGIYTKIYELQKLFQLVDFEKLNNQKQSQLKQEFLNKFPQFRKQEKKSNQQLQQKLKQKKVPELTLIEALINFGANPNSSKSQSFWENYNNQNYEQGEYEQYSKFDQTINQTSQTVLHRAIMNDLPTLVSFLLKKGAKIDTKCRITVKTPIYPIDWPQKIKQRKKKQINKSIFDNQINKDQEQKKLKQCQNEQQKKRIMDNISYYQFQIFKAKRFVIENQLPSPTYTVKELTCLQIAEALKVSQETKQIILDNLKNNAEANPKDTNDNKEVKLGVIQ